jgi:hypothetical protein
MPIPLNESLNSEDFFKGTFMSYQIDSADGQFLPYEEFDLTHSEKHDFGIKPSKNITYKMNNYGHRSDDFDILDKTKTNVLFAGCSITFGDALPSQYRWTEFLYKDLDIENKGPFNSLGFLGGGSDKIVSNVMKYCLKFGNPDIIFILYSDFSRQTKYIPESKKFRSMIEIDYSTNPISLESESLAQQLFVQTQNYIRILEIYCKMNNIKLITSCWDSTTNDALEKLDLISYYPMHIMDPSKVDTDWVPKEDRKFLIKARDGHHDGIINNILMKEFFLRAYRGMV